MKTFWPKWSFVTSIPGQHGLLPRDSRVGLDEIVEERQDVGRQFVGHLAAQERSTCGRFYAWCVAEKLGWQVRIIFYFLTSEILHCL
jgi:hypothetical protein